METVNRIFLKDSQLASIDSSHKTASQSTSLNLLFIDRYLLSYSCVYSFFHLLTILSATFRLKKYTFVVTTA